MSSHDEDADLEGRLRDLRPPLDPETLDTTVTRGRARARRGRVGMAVPLALAAGALAVGIALVVDEATDKPVGDASLAQYGGGTITPTVTTPGPIVTVTTTVTTPGAEPPPGTGIAPESIAPCPASSTRVTCGIGPVHGSRLNRRLVRISVFFRRPGRISVNLVKRTGADVRATCGSRKGSRLTACLSQARRKLGVGRGTQTVKRGVNTVDSITWMKFRPLSPGTYSLFIRFVGADGKLRRVTRTVVVT